MEPVPVDAPIVFPVVVPIFTNPALTVIPYQPAVVAFVQEIAEMVLPCTLLATLVPTFRVMP